MFEIDARIVEILRHHNVRFSLIGASACAVHGLSRYSADVDLLTMDLRVLSAALWPSMLAAEVRHGDDEDPLAGVVRFDLSPPIDLIVGKGYAARLAVETAEIHHDILVASPLALVLLKLEAGGVKDRYDIIGLIDAQRALDKASWFVELDVHTPKLSKDARALWAELKPQLKLA